MITVDFSIFFFVGQILFFAGFTNFVILSSSALLIYEYQTNKDGGKLRYSKLNLYLLFCVDAKRGLSSNETTETERI
jgi:hypothetical protein